jgi:hypothetical protein
MKRELKISFSAVDCSPGDFLIPGVPPPAPFWILLHHYKARTGAPEKWIKIQKNSWSFWS